MNSAIINHDTIQISGRDLKVVSMIANGFRTREIAEELDLSVRTIEGIVDKIRFKVDAESQSHMVAIFFRKGLIS